MNAHELAKKELEVSAWMQKEKYDRKACKDVAPIIVKYLESKSCKHEWTSSVAYKGAMICSKCHDYK